MKTIKSIEASSLSVILDETPAKQTSIIASSIKQSIQQRPSEASVEFQLEQTQKDE